MSVALLSSDEAKSILRDRPFEVGLSAELLGRGHVAEKKRAQKEYGCRHCSQTRIGSRQSKFGTTSGTAGPSASDARETNAGGGAKRDVAKTIKPLDFNAMRSHVKAK